MTEREIRQTIYDLSSSFFCEAAVLVAVFGFLDKAIREQPIRWMYGAEVLGMTALLLVIGFIFAMLRDR